MGKGPRTHSAIHVATSRDYDRKKLAEKHEQKLEKDYDDLERKMMTRAKWNQRAENNNLLQNPINPNNSDRSATSLEDFIQREKVKQDNIINAKRMGNERIRRSSINTLPKV
jgi:hypothetical protein